MEGCSGGDGKSNERREHCWSFSNVLWVENTLSVPPLKGNKDSCPVDRLYPYLLAVVPVNLCQPDFSFLHPAFIRCLLQGLCNFLSHPSCLLSSLQLCL